MKRKNMEAEKKELLSRKDEIIKELEILFKTNLKITDWDIPEADDRKAAEVLLEILQEGLEKIRKDVEAGKYDNY
ncbi:MAG: hypothetical protein GXO31_04760 [Epsilonproteobacteria bacterium]|nr:hypothetical protein [Campylobacterota bacterium]